MGMGFGGAPCPLGSRSGDGEASGQQSEERGVGAGGSEMDTGAGGLFDDAGADFEQSETQGGELGLGEGVGDRGGVSVENGRAGRL